MRTRLILGFLALGLASSSHFAADTEPIGPPQHGRPAAAQLDSATVYLTSAGTDGTYFVFGTDPPRGPVWGEHLTLRTAPLIPLTIRSVSFGVSVSAIARLVAEFDIWDAYDTSASPVNSGLLRVEERDFGTLQPNVQGDYYEDMLVSFVPPLSLSDPDIFVEFRFKSDFGGSPPNRAFRPIADGNPDGPVVGASENDLYVDQDGDGSFTYSPPNAGDRRRIDNTTLCGPANCQANWSLHIRGERDPLLIDPGADLLQTAGGGTSLFLADLFYPGFFDYDDQGNFCVPAGFGSSDAASPPFFLGGFPATTHPAGVLGSTDTIVERLQLANLTLQPAVTIPILVRALSLQGTFVVTYDGGQSPTLFRVSICLSDNPQVEGNMTITRGACSAEGGTFAATLPVLPRLTFTQVDPPPTPPCEGLTFDFGPNGLPAEILTIAGGHWLADAPAGLGVTESALPVEVEGSCDGLIDGAPVPPSSNFHPALRVPSCPGEVGCTGRPPVVRAERWSSPWLSQAFLPAASAGIDSDADGLDDGSDNCPLLPNPGQADSDGDAIGDECDGCPTVCGVDVIDEDGDGVQSPCDNCPLIQNVSQANADGDAFGDACDCNPIDPQNDGPDEVTNLRFPEPPPDEETLTWGAPPFAGGYQLVRGSLAALPVGPGGGDETCLGPPPGNEWVDPTQPQHGEGYFYVVRAVDGCGPAADFGAWGGGAVPIGPRQLTTCP